MKKNIPLAIVLVLGLLFIIQFFIPSKISQQFYDNALEWDFIIGIPALVIAIDSLVHHHVIKIQHKKKGWVYSWVYLGAAMLMTVIGFAGGIREGSLFMNLFTYAMAPMQSSVFAILAYYMTSAAYRAFRARSAEATLLLVSAFIVMLGLIPLGAMIWKGMPAFSEWMMLVPNMASKRGITFGIGLGSAATTLKIILGIERSWLGGGGE